MPTPILDADLRAVVFAHVLALKERFAGRIPGRELNLGVYIAGQRIPVWNYQRGIYKPAILGTNGAALSVQTSADSPYEDEQDPEAGHFVYKYQGSNQEHADNRALRNSMLAQRPILYLIAVDPGYYDAICPVYVVGDDPTRLQFLMVADQSLMIGQDAHGPTATARREYVTRAVMQRLHQQHFRRQVLRAYRERCCICQLGHVPLLDAAHILPDKHPKGEPIVSNGLGMCKIHHSAFDANIVGIDADARVHVRRDIVQEEDGPMLKHGLQEMHGVRLVLPRHIAARPNQEFLAERFAAFLAA
jgi:putative restriction endonuclease